jgi:hypothetical protein
MNLKIIDITDHPGATALLPGAPPWTRQSSETAFAAMRTVIPELFNGVRLVFTRPFNYGDILPGPQKNDHWETIKTAWIAAVKLRPERILMELPPRIVGRARFLTRASMSGFNVASTEAGACDLGAPHHRHREYVLAVRANGERLRPIRTTPTPECRVTDLPYTPVAAIGRRRGVHPGYPGQERPRGDIEWMAQCRALETWEAATRPMPPLREPSRGRGAPNARVTAKWIEWQMGLPEGWCEGGYGAAIRGAASSSVPQVVAHAYNTLCSALEIEP